MSTQASSGFSGSFRTIKYNHLFIVDDPDGYIPPNNLGGLGFYYLDTRHLSQFDLFINDLKPITLLSSTESGNYSTLVYTNNQFESLTEEQSRIVIPQETILVKRESVLNGAWFERFSLVNYNETRLNIKLSFRLAADFKDIFEVRNFLSIPEQKLLSRKQKDNSLTFSYEDALGHVLETKIIFEDFKPIFTTLENGLAEFHYETMLYPQEEQFLNLQILPVSPIRKSFSKSIPKDFNQAFQKIKKNQKEWSLSATRIETDNEEFNLLLNRCHQDVYMLMTKLKHDQAGEDIYLAAGIPWYVALFGRDSILSARSCLMLKPDLARTTLKTLAKYQGTKIDAWRDEAPGKILHELRVGELARLDRIPHTPYYGTVDATPLWLILLYEYYLWTQDIETLQQLWPNAMAALSWIDNNLNSTPLGYLTYETESERGLYHQCWKDSSNSAMYGSGKQAKPPLAHAEVQGYVYAAKMGLAQLAKLLGNVELQNRLLNECQIFKQRFNQDFWMPEHDYFAMALDEYGKQLDVISSNPGHCLETGIINEEYIEPLVKRLMSSDMFNGWGIRTLSSKMASYNPMSYHNGSIWPHDNALIARGLASVGKIDEALLLFSTLMEVGRLMLLKRIPELYCGFSRDEGKSDPPVRYPVACSPQAWAATSVYSFLQVLLNMQPKLVEPDKKSMLTLHHPRLPRWINEMSLKGLRVGKACVSLDLERTAQSVLINITEKQGDFSLSVMM